MKSKSTPSGRLTKWRILTRLPLLFFFIYQETIISLPGHSFSLNWTDYADVHLGVFSPHCTLFLVAICMFPLEYPVQLKWWSCLSMSVFCVCSCVWTAVVLRWCHEEWLSAITRELLTELVTVCCLFAAHTLSFFFLSVSRSVLVAQKSVYLMWVNICYA